MKGRSSLVNPYDAGGFIQVLARKLHPAPCTLRLSPHTLRPNLYTLHPTPYTIHRTPYTAHPAPYTLHPAPYTMHHAPYTIHHTPCTLHPTPHNLHPSSSLRLTPSTLHQTLSPNATEFRARLRDIKAARWTDQVLFFFSVLLSSLELSDANVHEPQMRALLLGTASQFCEEVVLKSTRSSSSPNNNCLPKHRRVLD